MGRGEGSGLGSGRGCGMGSGYYKGKTERFWIPALPLPLAIICCVFNFLIPGLGTAIVGLCTFCFARMEDMEVSSKCVSCLTSCGLAFLQMLTIMCGGWCWSCYWGVLFIMMSGNEIMVNLVHDAYVEYYHNNKVEDQDGVNRPAPTGGGTTTVIIEQPTFQPFQVIQPGTQPGPSVISHQPVVQPGTQPGPSVISHQPVVQHGTQPGPYVISHQPVVQPGTQPGPYVISHQPVAPPPYPGTSSVGMNQSVSASFSEPPLVRHADGSEQKIA